MKTMKFFAAIIAAFVITTSASANTVKNSASVSRSSQIQKTYIYNKVGEASSKVVYSTDEQGRVINKIILHMNNGEWTPVGAYSVYYGDSVNTVTYAGWNSNSRTFTKNPSQQSYDAKDYPVVIAMPE